jgi:hypothetical protein
MSLSIPKRCGKSPAYIRAPKQEREIAKRVGGRVTPGSGAGDEKADVRVRGLHRIECKATSRQSFSVTREMLDKLSTAAHSAGEMPVLVVEFLPTEDHAGGTVAICPEYVLDALKNT